MLEYRYKLSDEHGAQTSSVSSRDEPGAIKVAQDAMALRATSQSLGWRYEWIEIWLDGRLVFRCENHPLL